MISLVETPYKLTLAETLLSAAATLCLLKLSEGEANERTVNDICQPPQYGYTASASSEPCGPRFVRITDLQAGVVDWARVPYCECANPDPYMLAPGDLLVARSGSVGKSFLVGDVPEPAVFASYLIRLRANRLALPSYLFWCFQSQQFWHQTIAARRGSAMSNINGKMLADLRFPVPPLQFQEAIVAFLSAFRERLHGSDTVLPELPPPLDKQQRIVARIEELAARIEEARNLKTVTNTESQRFWKVLSRMARDTEWPVRSLDEMVEFLDGRRIPLSEVERTSRRGEYPYYGASGIIDHIDDYIFDEDLLLLSEDGANLINRSTPIAFVASGRYWVNNHAHVLRPVPNVADLRFLAYALSDYDVSVFNFASAQAKLNQSNARKITFPLPPIQEQQRIVEHLNEMGSKITVLERLQMESAAQLDALLPSVLDKAFRGEL